MTVLVSGAGVGGLYTALECWRHGCDVRIFEKGENGKAKLPRLGRWITDHDPQRYALENHEKAVDHVENNTPFRNTNVPPGFTYRPWTIDGLLEAQARGEPTILDGDWSYWS